MLHDVYTVQPYINCTLTGFLTTTRQSAHILLSCMQIVNNVITVTAFLTAKVNIHGPFWAIVSEIIF